MAASMRMAAPAPRRPRLRWRDRMSFGAAARRIETAWKREVYATMEDLVGQPVRMGPVGPGRTGPVLALDAGGRTLVLAGVAPSGAAAMEAVTRQTGAHLAGAGRYGPLWWLTVAGPGGRPATVATITASRLTFGPADGGRLRPPSPLSQPLSPPWAPVPSR